MKRQSVRNAYRNIRPSDEAKERMLQNILLSSEILPAGKEKPVRTRRFGRFVLIAAIIAMLAGTVAVASGLRKVPVKETASFISNDGSIEFYLDIDTEVTGEVVPMVEVVPHFFTGEEIKHVAKVLFGDAQFYEEEPFDHQLYSKQEIQTKLDRWRRYSDMNALEELFPGKVEESTYMERALEVVNQFLHQYSEMLKDAPTEDHSEPCRWELRNWIEYMYPEEEWAEHYSDEYNMEISATTVVNGIPYYFGGSQRDHETFRVNNISAGIGGEVSPFGIDDLIYKAELCRTSEPTEEQLNLAKEKAENWLSQMNMGSWMVDECYVQTRELGEFTEYYIHVNAVPVFYGVPAIRREQITALRGREEGKTYYYYTDAQFTFAPNGELMTFRMYSPVDIVSTDYETETLSVEELLEIAKENLISSSASSYSYIPSAYEGMCEVGCKITVRDIDYSLTRMTDEDTRQPFIYSLGASLSGSIEYYDKATGEVLDYVEDRILLVLDGMNGTFISRG